MAPLWVADARGGVVRLQDGRQDIVTQRQSEHFDRAGTEATRYLEGTLPNGLAFARNGDILISNFGTDCLEVMSRDGMSRVLADSIDGEPIGGVNFVLRDSRDRIWITVSTRIKNWMHALRADLADGYVARYESGTGRIVADGFHFTNEIGSTPTRSSWPWWKPPADEPRLRVDERGNLRDRGVRPVEVGPGRLAGRHRLRQLRQSLGHAGLFGQAVRPPPDGDMRVLLDEGDPAKVDALEQAFFRNHVTEDVLFATGQGRRTVDGERGPSADLRTVYIWLAQRQAHPCFRAPIAGLPMVHWHERL